MTTAPDMISSPPHYSSHPSGVECVVLAEWLGFAAGSAFAYLWRYGLKGDRREQLEKARWFVERKLGHPTDRAPERDRSELPPEVIDAYHRWEAADPDGPVHDAMTSIWASVFSIAPTADLQAALVCIDNELNPGTEAAA